MWIPLDRFLFVEPPAWFGNVFGTELAPPAQCGGQGDCAIYIDPQGGETVPVEFRGNQYNNNGAQVIVSGSAYAFTNDKATPYSGARGLGVVAIKNASLAIDGSGGLIWRSSTGGMAFQQYMQSGILYWVDGAGAEIGGIGIPPTTAITPSHEFRFGKIRGDAEVRSNAIVTAPTIEASSQLKVGNDIIGGAPRATFSAFFPGTLSVEWTAATFTPDRAIRITRVQVQLKTAQVGCGVHAFLTVSNGSSAVSVGSIQGVAYDQPVAVDFAASTPIAVSVLQPASGCTVWPADANVIVQYRMQ